MEQSYYDCPDGIGGSPSGQNLTWLSCNNSKIEACDMLYKMANASEEMMIQRAKTSKNSNFLIIQHYPGRAAILLEKFKRNKNENHYDDTINNVKHNYNNDHISINVNEDENYVLYSAAGHAHIQQCERYKNNTSNTNNNNNNDNNNNDDIIIRNNTRACEIITTGGGGGCCHEDSLRGFFVISFNDNKEMIQEYNIRDPLLTCQYPCNATIGDLVELEIDACCNHVGDHGVDCTNFDLNKICVNDAVAFCT